MDKIRPVVNAITLNFSTITLHETVPCTSALERLKNLAILNGFSSLPLFNIFFSKLKSILITPVKSIFHVPNLNVRDLDPPTHFCEFYTLSLLDAFRNVYTMSDLEATRACAHTPPLVLNIMTSQKL